MSANITIKEVAMAAGVGLATTSYALNGTGAAKVSTATRQRIREIAVKLGYEPNLAGRSLKSGRSYLVGVLVPQMWPHEVMPVFLQGIEDELNRNGLGLLLCTYQTFEELEKKSQFLLQKRVDGFIVFPAPATETAYYTLYRSLEKRVPVVAASGNYQEVLPRVLVDGAQIGFLGTDYLCRNGHRRIDIVSELNDWRMGGYTKALAKHGVPFDERMIYHDFREPVTQIASRIFDWLRAFPPETRPTAVFCQSEIRAAQLLKLAQDAGWHLPQDLSVLGTDDLPFGQLVTPRISTVDQPHYQQGVEGARLLETLLAGKPVQNVLLKGKLIIRESVFDWTKKGLSYHRA